LTHEAGVAILQLAPDRFWDFSEKLFEEQAEFFDANVVNETRNATYKRLAKIAAQFVDEQKFYELLEISDKPGKDGSLNTGNAVTNDLKVLVKTNRRVGVHVTPTVIFNVSHHIRILCSQGSNVSNRVSRKLVSLVASAKNSGKNGWRRISCRLAREDNASQTVELMMVLVLSLKKRMVSA